MKKLADYKDMVFVPCAPTESHKMRKALLGLDEAVNAIQERQRQEGKRERNDSCSPIVGAFIDSLGDEQTMTRVVEECASEAVRLCEL